MGNFFTDVLTRHPLFRASSRVSDLAMLEPNVRRKVLKIIEEARCHGLDLIAYETYRSQERQQALFKQKVTQLRTVGVHHYGLACDLVRVANGEPTWDGDYSLVGHLARAHGLVWGGDWPSLRDEPHVQWCRVRDQAKLFRGDWYPDAQYDPTV